MADAVEYNLVAITDAKLIISRVLSTENVQISFNSSNLGESYERIQEIAREYNEIENHVRSLMQQVEKMLEDVINAVNELESK